MLLQKQAHQLVCEDSRQSWIVFLLCSHHWPQPHPLPHPLPTPTAQALISPVYTRLSGVEDSLTKPVSTLFYMCLRSSSYTKKINLGNNFDLYIYRLTTSCVRVLFNFVCRHVVRANIYSMRHRKLTFPRNVHVGNPQVVAYQPHSTFPIPHSSTRKSSVIHE